MNSHQQVTRLNDLSDWIVENSVEEYLKSDRPHLKIEGQVLALEKWPKTSCSSCYGTGFKGRKVLGTISKKQQPNLLCRCGSGKKSKKCCQQLTRTIPIVCSCVGRSVLLREKPSIPVPTIDEIHTYADTYYNNETPSQGDTSGTQISIS